MTPGEAKRKGAKTEQMLVDWLNANGLPHVERRHLSGANDEGDIAGWPGVAIEVKSGAKVAIAGWLAELAVEMENARAETGAVVVRPKGKPAVDDWYAVMPVPVWLELMAAAGWVAEP